MELILPIALACTGTAALINLWLGYRIGVKRRATGILLGDGGDPGLVARMRAQANFTEFTPYVLLLIALIEYTVGSTLWLWIVGVIYMLARIIHALGMTGLKKGRHIGTLVTFVITIGLAVCAFLLPLIYKADYLTSADTVVIEQQVD